MQERADLKLCEQSRPAVVDDDVGHALEKFQNGQVLLLAEIDAYTLVGGVAADHGHPLQPRDGVAQVSVDLDAAVFADLMKAPDGQRPLVLGQRLDWDAPKPDVAMGHVIVAVGQYDAIGGPGGGVDSRQRHRYVSLASPPKTRTQRDHARLQR